MVQEAVIRVENVHKTYGSIKAVDGVSFEVYRGEIFGMVGPNGAGKTTTIEIVEGLRRADEGQVRVLDLDPVWDYERLVQRIGVQLQEAALPPRVRVGEILDTVGAFYTRTMDAGMLLEQLGLAERRDAFFGKLSGGQKQRLFAALALVNDPEVVFLDEISTGLDPQARRNIWDFVRALRDQDKTVFLTTHYMEEAETLCDRVAIMDYGRIVALDTPANLVRSLEGEQRLVFELLDEVDVSFLEEVGGVTRVLRHQQEVTVYGKDGRFVEDTLLMLSTRSIRYRNLRTVEPTLEDVFLALTGRAMRE
jgi:ABC-2 type transport system ATP-binding protein